jgi:hypothetical protein
VKYLELCNEVLIRLREDEITDVKDPDNEPQQKLVTRFVNDALSFVDKSHTWNAKRRAWLIDLKEDMSAYTIDGLESSSLYTVQWSGSGGALKEADARWIASQPNKKGRPAYFSQAYVSNHNTELRIWPTPDEKYQLGGDVDEYSIAEYFSSEYNSAFQDPNLSLIINGFKECARLKENDDIMTLPLDPVLYFALAYSSRERGEVGGQSSMELFALAKSYLTDAISWDVSKSSTEYLWEVA